MPVCLSSDQVRLFSINGLLPLVEACDHKTLLKLNKEIKGVTNDSSYRDLWMRSVHVRSLFTNGLVAQIASCLWWSQSSVRVLYDQVLFKNASSPYFDALSNGSFCLSHHSCFDEILGAVLVCVNGHRTDWHQFPSCVLPENSGDILCVNGVQKFGIHVDCSDDLVCYMAVFGTEKSKYLYNRYDPYVFRLKSKGYCFDQQLRLDTHPLIRKSLIF